jgi:lysophospholipase L1-like esterase
MPTNKRWAALVRPAGKALLLVAIVCFGAAGCGESGTPAHTGSGGSGGQAGGHTGSGGQTGQGGSSAVGTGGRVTGGAPGSGGSAGDGSGGATSIGTGGKGGASTGGSGAGGTPSTGGGSGSGGGGAIGTGGNTPSTGGAPTGSATGGSATGGSATGSSPQGGTRDGGQGGSGGSDSGADASVDRATDSPAILPDGGDEFAPCPSDGTACKIMPLGDSITDGVGSSGGGYRVELFKQSLTNNQSVTFVGRNLNGPTSVTVSGQTKPFPRNHEGYSGYTIDTGGGRTGISTLVDAGISASVPHIVLLMIGTNDVNISLDLTNAPTRLGALLDRIAKDAPKALIVVAKLVPTTNDTTNTRVRTYNDAIPGLVQTRAAAGKHIVMVDMYTAFTSNTSYKTALMNDELHPKDAGYAVMAQTWYAALKSYLR